jgi:hypothetical protein
MNYSHLVILGCGSIGGALLKVGRDDLSDFKRVTVIDKEKRELPGFGNIRFAAGDLNGPETLKTVLSGTPGNVSLVVNLTEGLDNLAIRRLVSEYRAAYLDSGAGIINAFPKESRLSRLMPYSQTVVPGNYPQWTCWGVNPGLVEIAARRMLEEFDNPEDCYAVRVFEHDRLSGQTRSGRTAVGWSPNGLVNEISQTPTFEIVDGKKVEHRQNKAKNVRVAWDGQTIAGKKVAHEEVWNFGRFLKAWSAFFVYALSPEVMEIIKRPAREAISNLGVPTDGDPITGKEQVAVQVRNLNQGKEKCLVWEEEHGQTRRRYGVNAVQLQTCRGIQLAIRLLQHTRLGRTTGNFCASNLPLEKPDWDEIDRITRQLNINWRSAKDSGPVIVDE